MRTFGLTNIVGNILSAFQGTGRKKSPGPRRRPRRACLEIENLEERIVTTVGLTTPLVSYSLQQGNLYETELGTTTLLDTHVKSFAPESLGGTNYLFDLNSSGQLKSTNGSGWVVQDTTVTSFACEMSAAV